MLGVDDCFRSRMHGNSEIIQTLLNFVWNFWDHPLEVKISVLRIGSILRGHIWGNDINSCLLDVLIGQGWIQEIVLS